MIVLHVRDLEAERREEGREHFAPAEQFARAVLGGLLLQIIPAQKVDRVGEDRRRDIVKERGERRRGLAGKMPCDARGAEAVVIPAALRQILKAREGGIFTAAVHADLPQPLQLRQSEKRREKRGHFGMIDH